MDQLGRQMIVKAQRDALFEYLAARRFHRAVTSPEFEATVRKASPEELSRLKLILASREAEGVVRWTKEADRVPLELMNSRQLRALAAELMIPRYSRISRDELFRAIRTEQGRRDSERNAADSAME